VTYEQLYTAWEKQVHEVHAAKVDLLKIKIEVAEVCVNALGFHPASDVLAKQVVALLMQKSDEQVEANRER
jgi:hypothetical protein